MESTGCPVIWLCSLAGDEFFERWSYTRVSNMKTKGFVNIFFVTLFAVYVTVPNILYRRFHQRNRRPWSTPGTETRVTWGSGKTCHLSIEESVQLFMNFASSRDIQWIQFLIFLYFNHDSSAGRSNFLKMFLLISRRVDSISVRQKLFLYQPFSGSDTDEIFFGTSRNSQDVS